MKEALKTACLLLKCYLLKRIKLIEIKYVSKILHKKIINPWMEYKELEIIKDILKRAKPLKCLEWGAGYSTIYFSNYVNSNSEWVSVEDNKDWAETTKKINKKLNVKIFYVQPNQFPWTDEFGDGNYSDLRDYVEFPVRFGNFDFIIVDGRARNDCLIKAYEIINNEGVVVLHDANRSHYHKSFRLFKYQVIFKDSRLDSGGIWIGSKGVNIHNLFDVNKHRNLWRVYNKIGKSREEEHGRLSHPKNSK